MLYTYSGDPGASDLDYVRFGIGDTDMETPFLSDEEIKAVLIEAANREKAKVSCMEFILSKLSQECDYQIGPEKVSASQRYDNYRILYERVYNKLCGSSTVPQETSTEAVFNMGIHDQYTSISTFNGSW